MTMTGKRQVPGLKQAETTQRRYSLRKVASVGAASALIGTFVLLGGPAVQADETIENVGVTSDVSLPSENTPAPEIQSQIAEFLTSSETNTQVAPSSETPALTSEVSTRSSEEPIATPLSEVSINQPRTQVAPSNTNTASASSEVANSLPLASSETSQSAQLISTEAQAKLNQLQGQVQSVVAGAFSSDQILALTEEEIRALNRIDFNDTSIKGTGTSLTYRNLKDIVASFLEQDSKLAVPYFKADTIINMPAFDTVDAQTMEKEEIDVWDSWPVQDAESGIISNWNGYQLVISMAGAANRNSNHIYLLYNKYGDNDFANWKNAGPIFGYNALEDDQQWSGSATVNSDGSIQLYYTKNDTSDGKLNWQQLASATLNLAVENDEVVIKSVENDQILFGGDGYHYQNYPQFMATFNDDHNQDGIPDRTDNYCLRDPHIIEDNGSRYLIFEANTGTENYQGEKQIFNWSNYGGDDSFNLSSFLNINNNKHLYNLASWANGAIGILKLDDNEKKPSVAEVYTPLVTSHMVTDEVERPSVVKMGNKYYLFTASRINKSTDAEGTVAAREAVGDDVVMLGFVSDSLRGEYRPLNGSGVVLTASVPADWRTSTYSYYAVPVEGSSDTLLVTSYMTNRGGIAGAENKSTWAPSFLIRMNADDTTEVLPKMTNQGDWIWDASSDSKVHVADQNSAKLPDEDFNVDYYAVSNYGLKPHTYPEVDGSTGVDQAQGILTVTGDRGATNQPSEEVIVVPIQEESTTAPQTHNLVTLTNARASNLAQKETVSGTVSTTQAWAEETNQDASQEQVPPAQEPAKVVEASRDKVANDSKQAAKLVETTKVPSQSTASGDNLLPILASIFAAIAALAGLGYGLVTGKIKWK